MSPFSGLVVLFIVSLIANVFSAFAGGGAGLLQLPVLIFFGLPFGVALATHKLATVALGLGATVRHWRERTLDVRFSLFVLAAGLPGVILGSLLILRVPDRVAQIALGVLTLGLGLYSFAHRELGQEHRPLHRNALGMTAGGLGLFVIGTLNGSLSSGTGLFCTLWLVRWFGLDYKRAVAYTLVLVGLFWNGAGALTLSVLGRVQWSWVPVLLSASFIGGYIGAHFAIVRGNYWIKRAFEVVTILVGVKLLW